MPGNNNLLIGNPPPNPNPQNPNLPGAGTGYLTPGYGTPPASGGTGGGATSSNAGNGTNREVDPVRVNIGQPTFDSFRQYGDATMAEYRRNLDPMFADREARFRQDMVNRGLQEGTEAYDRAYANFDRGRNDANNSAANAALQASLGAQQQAFGQNFSESQLANALLQSREGNQTQLSIANSNQAAQSHAAQSAAEIQRQNFLDQLGFQREQLTDDRSRWDQNFARDGSQWDQQFGFGQQQWNDQFGLQSGQADFGNMMQLLGQDFGANQYNNQMTEQDFNRASSLFGMTPQGGPTQLDVMSPYQMQQQQLNANAGAANANAQGNQQALVGIATTAATLM